jgi:hypothetical protein
MIEEQQRDVALKRKRDGAESAVQEGRCLQSFLAAFTIASTPLLQHSAVSAATSSVLRLLAARMLVAADGEHLLQEQRAGFPHLLKWVEDWLRSLSRGTHHPLWRTVPAEALQWQAGQCPNLLEKTC